MRALLVVLLTGTTLWAQGGPPIAEDTRAALVNRVDEARRTVGIAVGVLSSAGRSFAAHGAVSKGGAAPTAETMFEIGSITKVFTALLLADMVERGEVALEDPVSKYLPESVKVPGRNGREITLADLTTHTSGLPRIPSNMDPTNLDNPYADYDSAKLYSFLSSYALPRDPGVQYEYSNLGAGLLGHALARRAGMSYEALLKARILQPLGMKSTTITLSTEQRTRTAAAHDETLTEVRLWDLDALAGAGAIRSTVSDMLTFAAAHLGLVDTPLKRAIERMRIFRRPGPSPNIEQAMGWLAVKPVGNEILIHDGGTHGFRSALALDPANKRAAVVWTNSPLSVNDIVAHAVEPKAPLPMLAAPRPTTQLPETTLVTYLGVYEIAPTLTLTVTRETGRMYVQLTGQPRFEMFAEREGEFFLKVVPAQISFVKEDSGAIVSAILHQNGQDIQAKKTK